MRLNQSPARTSRKRTTLHDLKAFWLVVIVVLDCELTVSPNVLLTVKLLNTLLHMAVEVPLRCH